MPPSSVRRTSRPLPSFVTFVHEALCGLESGFGAITVKSMFGGWCYFAKGAAFALAADDRLYLKVDDGNRPAFLEAGLKPFVPFPDRPDKTMSYYTVPSEALDDPEILRSWAKGAIEAAQRAAARKKKRPRAPAAAKK
jgi:DNA transformation protein and related proteins